MSSAAQQQAARAIVTKANQYTMVYFAASMLGLLAVISIFHFVGEILQGPRSKNTSVFPTPFISTARCMRGILLRKVPGFTSAGHACVFVLYLAINFTLTFQNLHSPLTQNFAKRMGWITASNLALVVFLALKNTPLAFLTSFSHERLNILHQAVGYSLVVSAMLHAITYLVQLSQAGTIRTIMREQNQIMGIVAGSALLLILITSLTFRRMSYEAFYITHIFLSILFMVAVGLHRPVLASKVGYAFIFTGSIWGLDYLYRFAKLGWFAYGNTAHIIPLPQRGVRIVLSRAPKRAVPGSHVFLWIPEIRKTETHPFTVVSNNPLELVISTHDGFTKDLLSFASKNPGARVRASCDGPYGTLPNFSKFNNIILIAGGSGASFTFGVALNLIRTSNVSINKPVVHFIWVIRNHEQQSWFAKELAELDASPLVFVTIHITRTMDSALSTSTANKLSDNKGAPTRTDYESPQTPNVHQGEIDIEKGYTDEGTATHNSSVSSLSANSLIVYGRPNIAATILEIVNTAESSDSTIVSACGPEELMLQARRAVAGLVSAGTRNVSLHCEQFGW